MGYSPWGHKETWLRDSRFLDLSTRTHKRFSDDSWISQSWLLWYFLWTNFLCLAFLDLNIAFLKWKHFYWSTGEINLFTKQKQTQILKLTLCHLKWWKSVGLTSKRAQWSSFFLSFFSSSTWHLHNTSLNSFEEIFLLPFVLGLAGNNACPAFSKVNFLGLFSAFPWCSRMAAVWLEPNPVDTQMSEMVQVTLQQWPTRCQSLGRISRHQVVAESCSRLYGPQCPGSFHPSPNLPPPLPVASFRPLCPTLYHVNKSPFA